MPRCRCGHSLGTGRLGTGHLSCGGGINRARLGRGAVELVLDLDVALLVTGPAHRQLAEWRDLVEAHRALAEELEQGQEPDRKSVVSGKSVSVRVDLGGRRIIQKKTRYHI